VAEGVETRQTWQQLRALGCDEAQGYWLARPSPADGVPARIAETQRRTADGAGAGSVSPTTGGAQ
jgi:EAL domain-containing protein (putative c-di-GMP-specific phosphodiesterase class I)